MIEVRAVLAEVVDILERLHALGEIREHPGHNQKSHGHGHLGQGKGKRKRVSKTTDFVQTGKTKGLGHLDIHLSKKEKKALRKMQWRPDEGD